MSSGTSCSMFHDWRASPVSLKISRLSFEVVGGTRQNLGCSLVSYRSRKSPRPFSEIKQLSHALIVCVVRNHITKPHRHSPILIIESHHVARLYAT